MFDTLYKRASNGTIRYWKIEVEGSIINRESGQLGGTPVYYSEIVEGKNMGRSNETSDEEQALKEAKSLWIKQHDHGYKTLQDLGITATNIKEHDLVFMLDNTLPKYNTDANGNIKPMLAKPFGEKWVRWPALLQPKLDGVRCLMIIDSQGQVQFLSRSGKFYTTLDHIGDDVRTSGLTDLVLDGEIYSHEISFQAIISAVKKEGPDTPKLKFRAYDMVNGFSQSERLQILCNSIKLISSDHVTFVETLFINNLEEVMEHHARWVADGYEGAMVRNAQAKYKQGTRSYDLLKVKKFDEDEFKCNGLITGKRKEDLIALCETAEGKLFKAKMMGSREEKEIYEQHFQSGGRLTVKFFGWTDYKIPRFPIGKSFRNYE